MVGPIEDSPRGGAAERLGLLRSAPAVPVRRIRPELFVGGVLVAGALVAFLIVRPDRTDPSTVALGSDVVVESAESPADPALGEDEALVAVALEAGDFPPGLVPGDHVMVTVRPDLDADTDPRSIGRSSKVAAIEPPVAGDVRWIVVLRADRKLPEELVGSRRVSLSIIAGGAE